MEQSQNIFIFSAYTDACTSSCKIVVASKRPLITVDALLRAISAVHRLDNDIHRIGVDKTNCAVRWRVIYLLDSIIHIINNRGLALRFTTQLKYFQVLFSQTILDNATANISHSFFQFLSCIKIGTNVYLALLFNYLNNRHMPLNRKRKITCL